VHRRGRRRGGHRSGDLTVPAAPAPLVRLSYTMTRRSAIREAPMSEQPDGTGPRHGPPASDAGEGAAPPPPDGTAPGAAPDREAPGTGAPSPAGSGPEQGARRPSGPADPPGAPARPDTAGPPASGAPAGAPAPSEGPDPAGSPAPPAAPGAARTGAAPAPRAGAPGHAGPGRPGPGNGAPPQPPQGPPQAGPPAHQGPPAGPPPRGPQGPSDAGQTPEAPRANRGCATAAVAVLALGALVLVGAGGWAVVGLIGPGGYEKVPECAVAEGETLDELVPEAEAEVDDRMDGMEQEGREGEQCRWASGEDSAHTPSAVRVVMVRAGTEGGSAGEEAAAEL